MFFLSRNLRFFLFFIFPDKLQAVLKFHTREWKRALAESLSGPESTENLCYFKNLTLLLDVHFCCREMNL